MINNILFHLLINIVLNFTRILESNIKFTSFIANL